MDLIYGLVGGFVLTWLLGMLIKNTWVTAVVAYVVTAIGLGMLPAGVQPLTLLAALVGVAIAAYMGMGKKK